MTESRRDFIKGSIALSLLTVSSSASAQTKTIGLVHSAGWADADPLEACFKEGLKAAGGWTPAAERRRRRRHASAPASKPITYHYKAMDGGYGGQYGGSLGQNAITTAIQGFGAVDLIVAAGGNISAQAAADAAAANSNVKFVFLLGVMPAAGFGAGAQGGVNLDTPSQNQARINALTSVNDKTKICLVQNYNSAMAGPTGPEATAWANLNAGPVVYFFESGNPDPTDPKDVKSAIAASIGLIPLNALGLVISADPLFRDARVRTGLAKALSNLKGVSVCYPFPDFLGSHPGATSVGPPLASPNPTDTNSAYYGLGVKAGKSLSGSTVGTTTWDSVNNKWDSPF
jgi:hypothetical protein